MHGISKYREKTYREIVLYISSLTLLTVLLAASGQNRCTSLVCSCYVPSRNFNNKGDQESNRSNNTKKGLFGEKREYGVMEEAGNNESVLQDHQKSINGGRNTRSSSTSGSNNGPHLETSTLKSNLKKTTCTIVGENQARKDNQKRKVSWPDIAQGTDIAHVLEFEPSISDDGELEGVRNSCVCTIQ